MGTIASGRRRRALLGMWSSAGERPRPERVAALKRVLERADFVQRPREWRRAMAGDAAAATGLALYVLDRRQSVPSQTVDLVMSLILVLALKGDATARLLLDHARARGAAPGEDVGGIRPRGGRQS